MALNQDGMHFVLYPNQCNRIEGVVLNRACIKGFFVLNWVRFQTLSGLPIPKYWSSTSPLVSLFNFRVTSTSVHSAGLILLQALAF